MIFMRDLGFDVINMRIDVLKGSFGFLRVNARRIVFQAICVIDIVNVKDSINILPHDIKNFLKG